MKKRKTVMQIAALALLMIFTALLIAVSIGSSGKAGEILFVGKEEKKAIAELDGEQVDGEGNYNMPKSLTFLTGRSVEGALNVKFTATVRPDNALNQAVDWTCAWEEGAERSAEAVGDYVTVTPESDGSRTVTVTCLKSFEGDVILLTVTTREGGFTAVCELKCRQNLQTMTIANEKIRKGSDKYRLKNTGGEDYYNLEVGKTYEFPIVGTSSAGEPVNGEYEITGQMLLGGRLWTGSVYNSPGGSPTWNRSAEPKNETNIGAYYSQCVEAKIEDNALKITTKGDPADILGSHGSAEYYEFKNVVLSETRQPFSGMEQGSTPYLLHSFYNEFLIYGESMNKFSYFSGLEIQNGYGVINSIESMNANELGKEISGGNDAAAVFKIVVRETKSKLTQTVYFWIGSFTDVTEIQMQPNLTLTCGEE